MTEVQDPGTIQEELALRGRRRLAVAKNAIAWAMFGTEDEEEITISEGEGIACERAAIRTLTHLKDGGFIDNEPLLGLATTRELLEELEARGRIGLDVAELTLQDDFLQLTAEALLKRLPEEVLDYRTTEPRSFKDNPITVNTGEDAEKEETTQ